ncbi:hypothetical protein [Paraburkholderia sp. SOS3]|uniref:hypothetical protein n=1 Tax=Paraburkholderia sp. SOS3 TaxID=1926494 RepID=UPI0009476FBC|nr:hypothetical protein [Paraburkholderia sp. SOS3]APR40026.1 hypothetical protein BTO02_33335 [Paraburkholderia sp. SOS3]APR40508.1 hypothetical protein BTO02_33750 [Paraburkholderia sp. SOS3]
MSVAAQIVVAAQTAAANSVPIQRTVSDGPFTVVAGGLGSGETVTMQVQDASGNWQNVPSAIAPQLGSTVPALVMAYPGIFRFAKTATAAAVGVVLYSI